MATPHDTHAAARGGELRYGFVVGGLRLVPAAGVLTEMVADARVFPVPKAAAAVCGVLNLRGTIVPLFDVQALDHAAADIRPGLRRALVFDREEQRVGLLLEAAPELMSLVPAPNDALPPAGPLAPFLTRAWIRSDRPEQLWWQLDHRSAFASLARRTRFDSPAAALASTHAALEELLA